MVGNKTNRPSTNLHNKRKSRGSTVLVRRQSVHPGKLAHGMNWMRNSPSGRTVSEKTMTYSVARLQLQGFWDSPGLVKVDENYLPAMFTVMSAKIELGRWKKLEGRQTATRILSTHYVLLQFSSTLWKATTLEKNAGVYHSISHSGAL